MEETGIILAKSEITASITNQPQRMLSCCYTTRFFSVELLDVYRVYKVELSVTIFDLEAMRVVPPN